MNTENLRQAFEMLGQGMIGIFVVLGLIALLVKGMSWLDRSRKNK